MQRPTSRLAALVLAAYAPLGIAATLYKHVDKDGRVTYSDSPQAGSTAKVLTIPLDQNKLAPPPPEQVAPEPREESVYEKIIRRKPPEKSDAEVTAAKERLQSAKAALQAAQDSSRPEDWIRTSGGQGRSTTLRFPTPEYAERLAGLEANVKAAEENLADAERKARLQ